MIETTRGYGIRRVWIENRSLDQSYRVTLRLPANEVKSGTLASNRLRAISKTIEIAPSSIETATLFQPALPLYGDRCAVLIDGRLQEKSLFSSYNTAAHGAAASPAPKAALTGRLGGSSVSFQPRVLYCQNYGMMQDKSNRYIADASAALGKGMVHPNFIFANNFDNAHYSHPKGYVEPSWLNYSSFEGVLYDQRLELETARELIRYVECGGTFTLMFSASSRESVRGYAEQWIQDGSLSGSVDDFLKGFNLMGGRHPDRDVLETLDRRLLDRPVFGNTLERLDIGFGVLYLVGQDSESRQIPDSAVDIVKSWYEAEPAWNQLHTASGANKVLPMARPPDSRSSFISLFVLMLILAVLIGPAHLLILRRMNRREWVYWTTPAVSILACGAFALYALIAFGWSRQTRVVSLTHLDQGAGRAATIGWAAYYSPLTSSAELRFDENTELTPLAFGESLVGSIDWTGGQRLTGGWLPARVPRHFKLRKNEDRPERIDLKRDGGALKIVNRLGARVKSLWYADHDGAVYSAVDISNGAEAVLTETKGVHIGMKKLRDVYASQDWVAEIEAAQKSPAAYLQPGRYFAELEENVFVEKALRGAKMKPSIALVVGTLEG